MAEYIGYWKESEFPIFGGEHPKFAVLTDEGIIRCRDCIFFRKDVEDRGALIDFCARTGYLAFPNGYCAWGERDT